MLTDWLCVRAIDRLHLFIFQLHSLVQVQLVYLLLQHPCCCSFRAVPVFAILSSCTLVLLCLLLQLPYFALLYSATASLPQCRNNSVKKWTNARFSQKMYFLCSNNHISRVFWMIFQPICMYHVLIVEDVPKLTISLQLLKQGWSLINWKRVLKKVIAS